MDTKIEAVKGSDTMVQITDSPIPVPKVRQFSVDQIQRNVEMAHANSDYWDNVLSQAQALGQVTLSQSKNKRVPIDQTLLNNIQNNVQNQ